MGSWAMGGVPAARGLLPSLLFTAGEAFCASGLSGWAAEVGEASMELRLSAEGFQSEIDSDGGSGSGRQSSPKASYASMGCMGAAVKLPARSARPISLFSR